MVPTQATNASYAEKRRIVYQTVLQFASTMEVYLGLLLVISFAILPAIIYFQVMKIRYLTAPECQAAWREIDGKMLSLTTSPRCPSVLGVLYSKLRGAVQWLGAPPARPAAGGGGGLASKCTIM